MSQTRRNRTGLLMALLAILGLIGGVALGLLFGWVIMPSEHTKLADLAPEYKDDYVQLVAAAYYVDGDLEEAQARLADLDLPNAGESVSALCDRYILSGRDEGEIRALAALADALGAATPRMVAYLASPTPLPTDTPRPTSTPLSTDTPLPPTDTATPEPTATDTPTLQPTATDTATPQPSDTPLPPTSTPEPTKTPRPPTSTPSPTRPPTRRWTSTARLVGPGEDGQGCGYGNLQIRVTVVDVNGSQVGGVWIYDKYSKQFQLTGNVGSPDFGPGETKFEYGGGGGGSLCVASGQGGDCVSDFTRDMPCYYLPPIEDLYASGYCNCCEQGASFERCQQLINDGTCFHTRAEHFSWRVVFTRNW
jgi:hypothetical protein